MSFMSLVILHQVVQYRIIHDLSVYISLYAFLFLLGRLLKAFQIDFNWYHLASWINITEQWPFRTSWLILHYDMCEESLDDNMSLKSLYDKYA